MTMLSTTHSQTPFQAVPTSPRRRRRPPVTRRWVSEAEYWEKYYVYVGPEDHSYEWNNGYLEEKPMPDPVSYLMYDWLVTLLKEYLQVHPIAQIIGLETGFRLLLPPKRMVRKPDLGVVCHSNPVPLRDSDQSYHGVFDLCIESLSYSRASEIKRDTVTKKQEYAQGGVREYYILDARGQKTAFYQLASQGIYVPIPPVGQDLICSKVLPGFQFRITDLSQRPSVVEMSQDKVYQGFVGRELQEARQKAKAEKQKAKAERQKAKAERQKATEAWQRAQQAELQARLEREARAAAELKLQQLEAELARLRRLQ